MELHSRALPRPFINPEDKPVLVLRLLHRGGVPLPAAGSSAWRSLASQPGKPNFERFQRFQQRLDLAQLAALRRFRAVQNAQFTFLFGHVRGHIIHQHSFYSRVSLSRNSKFPGSGSPSPEKTHGHIAQLLAKQIENNQRPFRLKAARQANDVPAAVLASNDPTTTSAPSAFGTCQISAAIRSQFAFLPLLPASIPCSVSAICCVRKAFSLICRDFVESPARDVLEHEISFFTEVRSVEYTITAARVPQGRHHGRERARRQFFCTYEDSWTYLFCPRTTCAPVVPPTGSAFHRKNGAGPPPRRFPRSFRAHSTRVSLPQRRWQPRPATNLPD